MRRNPTTFDLLYVTSRDHVTSSIYSFMVRKVLYSNLLEG